MEGIGAGLIAVLVVISLAELALVIWALVDIARRPQTSALPRWGWVVVVIFFNLIGPAAYLLIGRKDQPVLDEWSATASVPGAPEPTAAQPSRTERAIDTLYGTEKSEE